MVPGTGEISPPCISELFKAPLRLIMWFLARWPSSSYGGSRGLAQLPSSHRAPGGVATLRSAGVPHGWTVADPPGAAHRLRRSSSRACSLRAFALWFRHGRCPSQDPAHCRPAAAPLPARLCGPPYRLTRRQDPTRRGRASDLSLSATANRHCAARDVADGGLLSPTTGTPLPYMVLGCPLSRQTRRDSPSGGRSRPRPHAGSARRPRAGLRRTPMPPTPPSCGPPWPQSSRMLLWPARTAGRSWSACRRRTVPHCPRLNSRSTALRRGT